VQSKRTGRGARRQTDQTGATGLVHEMKPSGSSADQGVHVDGNPAEQIRLQIDAGFSGVEKARQMQQVGSRVAAAEAVEEVRQIIARVRSLLPSASFTESQLGVVNKKIQALKDAAERVGGAPK
jgi:hypothetical protein